MWTKNISTCPGVGFSGLDLLPADAIRSHVIWWVWRPDGHLKLCSVLLSRFFWVHCWDCCCMRVPGCRTLADQCITAGHMWCFQSSLVQNSFFASSCFHFWDEIQQILVLLPAFLLCAISMIFQLCVPLIDLSDTTLTYNIFRKAVTQYCVCCWFVARLTDVRAWEASATQHQTQLNVFANWSKLHISCPSRLN